jgi:hypothetical protein
MGIDGQMITFDRNGTAIGPVEVVVTWAARMAAGEGSDTSNVVGEDGDLQGRPGELTVRRGDLFTLAGQMAEVSVAAKVDRGVAIAGFRLSTGGT